MTNVAFYECMGFMVKRTWDSSNKRDKKEKETNSNVKKPVEEVKESEDKTKKQEKKRKWK